MLFTKTLIILASVSSIFSQAVTCPVFDGCLVANDQFMENTCGPLSNNATFLAQCTCYQMYNRGLCYLQCPGVSEVSSLYEFNRANAVTQCNSVGLNAAALPSPPPWQSDFGKKDDGSTTKPDPTTKTTEVSSTETSSGERAVGLLFLSTVVACLLI
jgi:hypothetical protein